jgi:hypothetical protein
MRVRKTGATGLEPATSGVTGRVGHDDVRRRTPLNGPICRYFSPRRRTGSAWLSQSSDRRLGHEWATKSCLHRKRPERFGLQRGPRSEGSAPPLSGACRPAGRSREDGRPGATPLASASGTGPATWPPTARGTRSGSARVLRRPRLALIGRAHGAPEPAQPLVPRPPALARSCAVRNTVVDSLSPVDA